MKTKLTNEEQVALIKEDLRIDADQAKADAAATDNIVATAALTSYARWCRDLIARTDWTAEQFIHNRIPPAP